MLVVENVVWDNNFSPIFFLLSIVFMLEFTVTLFSISLQNSSIARCNNVQLIVSMFTHN